MKRQIVWVLAALLAIVPLSLASISPAGEGEWTQRADITARGELSTSAVGDHVYAIGGVTGWDYSGILSLVEEYDPESTAVEPREKLPTKWGEVKSE